MRETKRKLMILLTCAVLISAVFSGCADAPENVRSSNAETELHSGELATIPVSELCADIDYALSETYSNFTLREGMKVEIPDTITLCDFKYPDGRTERAEELAVRFLGEDVVEKAEFSTEEATEGGSNYSWPKSKGIYYNEELRVHFNVSDNGFIAFFKSVSFDSPFINGPRKAIYRVDRGEDLSGSYDIGGETVTVQQAADAAQEWLDKNYADVEPDYDIKVKTIIVQENESGGLSYNITADKHYKGIELDEINDTVVPECDEYKYITSDIMLDMRKGTEITSFTTNHGTPVPVEKGTADKIISLSSALGYIENTFTDFYNEPEISSIGLKYTLTPQNDTEHFQSADDCGVECHGELVWEFIIDVPDDELPHYNQNDPSAIEETDDVRKYIYINALTGEMDHEFDINRLG